MHSERDIACMLYIAHEKAAFIKPSLLRGYLMLLSKEGLLYEIVESSYQRFASGGAHSYKHI